MTRNSNPKFFLKGQNALIAIVEFVFVVIPLMIVLRSNYPQAWPSIPVFGAALCITFAIAISANNRDSGTTPSRR
jgi:uncharacterized membrane protein (DUF485 family)